MRADKLRATELGLCHGCGAPLDGFSRWKCGQCRQREAARLAVKRYWSRDHREPCTICMGDHPYNACGLLP